MFCSRTAAMGRTSITDAFHGCSQASPLQPRSPAAVSTDPTTTPYRYRSLIGSATASGPTTASGSPRRSSRMLDSWAARPLTVAGTSTSSIPQESLTTALRRGGVSVGLPVNPGGHCALQRNRWRPEPLALRELQGAPTRRSHYRARAGCVPADGQHRKSSRRPVLSHRPGRASDET